MFCTIYNFDHLTVLYHNLSDLHKFRAAIDRYKKQNVDWNTLHVLVYLKNTSYTESDFKNLESENIRIHVSSYNLDTLFATFSDQLKTLVHFTEEEKARAIHYVELLHCSHLVDNQRLNSCYNDIVELVSPSTTTTSNHANEVSCKNELKYLMTWWDENIIVSHSLPFTSKDLEKLLTTYKLPFCDNIWPGQKQTTLVFEDVFYINRRWFDAKTGNRIVNAIFDSDVEYCSYNEIHENSKKKYDSVDNMEVDQIVDHDVMYLDYIYGFYNFGEFWDCVKRLLQCPEKNKMLPLFHLSANRINEIEFYFRELGFAYPTDVVTQENTHKLYHFKKKIFVSTMKNYCRGYYDLFFAYHFNKTFHNLHTKKDDASAKKIYLKRGKHGRSMLNEERVVKILVEELGFEVVDGTETLYLTKTLFGNAILIVGCHGSLMKNIIWCQSNPILIDMSTRSDDMYANAKFCGFQSLFIKCAYDDKEQVMFTDAQESAFVDLLRLLSQKIAR